MLLLDEPLSALDAHTKVAVRGELQELLREFGLPTLLVTHDYEDAAALADQVGVIVDGELRQFASPQEHGRPSGRRRSSPRSRARTCCTGSRGPGQDGLTEIVLTTGESIFSADPGQGQVGGRRLSVGDLGRRTSISPTPRRT